MPSRSFGTGGKVRGPIGDLEAIALQRDGKIVAVGADFLVARYNPDGSLDASFGAGGVVRTSFGGVSQGGVAVAIQTDGEIIAAGIAVAADGNSEFALARYNPDGSLDQSFGTSGKVVTPTGWCCDFVHTILLRPDGKIVAIGQTLARYNLDGSLDTTFGVGGVSKPGLITK